MFHSLEHFASPKPSGNQKPSFSTTQELTPRLAVINLENILKGYFDQNLGRYTYDWIHSASQIRKPFRPIDLLKTLQILGKIQHTLKYNFQIPEKFINLCLEDAQSQIHEFSGAYLASVIHALVKMDRIEQYPSFKLFFSIWVPAAVNALKADAFQAQGLANSIWALAKLNASFVNQDTYDAFLRAWLACAQNKLESFNSQNLANSLWALAILNISFTNQDAYDGFIKAWLSCAQKNLGSFNT